MNLEKIFFVVLALILMTGASVNLTVAQNQKKDDKNQKVEKQKDDDDDDDKNDSPENQKKLAKQAKISMEEARRKALERVPGEILESELEKIKGRLVYDIDVRDKDKKVWDVLIDAKTGEIISVTEDEEDEDDDNSSSLPPVKMKRDLKWYEFWRKIPGLSKL